MNPSTALATVLVDELVRLGVREAVLSPGSRSAPLAYALEAAERAGRLRLHVRVDERSAGFLALGLAKVSRVPAVAVTTSGTAVANLHPAVLEAHHACVPLLVLTADRPPELRGTGANQTTEQHGIFGAAVRWHVDLAAPETRAGQNPVWRSTCDRAVSAALGLLGGRPGPVHLNVPLREPLVPGAAEGADWPESLDGRPYGVPWVVMPHPSPQPAPPDRPGGPRPLDASTEGEQARAIGHEPRTGRRTLVLVGDLPEPGQPGQAVRWAVRHGWPVIAEPFGDLADSVLPHGPLLLTPGQWLEQHLPELVLVLGRLTLSRAVAALLRRPGVRVEAVVPGPQWSDPAHAVAQVHPWRALDEPDGWSPGDRAWQAEWQEAGQALAKAVADAELPWPSGLATAAVVGESVPAGATLYLGSSNAGRDFDLGCRATAPGVSVVASRGLAGIDGAVSTAAGLALAGAGPTYALLGDLTFLHDTGALLIGPDEPRPNLTIVLVNDDGGGIFTLLEPGDPQLARSFERLFGTPTATDISGLCLAHGVAHQRISTRQELASALATAQDGIRVLEVAVDRDTHRTAHARLRQIAASALGNGS